MASGDFHNALEIYERKNAIAWTRTQPEARARLVRHWARDNAQAPSKTRFVFAYTNDAVAELNAALREVRKTRGELGRGQRFDTGHGAFEFSVNDRIQFTANDKEKGIINGFAGRITVINEDRITVQLDGKKARKITFDPYEFTEYRHGYAGTIYRGQGKTLDQTYLYHNEHWRSAASYVALTRHREKTEIFVARNTARDIKQLAKQMARNEERRAASGFYHGLDLTPLRPLTARQILDRFGGLDFQMRASVTPRKATTINFGTAEGASNDNAKQDQSTMAAAEFAAIVNPRPIPRDADPPAPSMKRARTGVTETDNTSQAVDEPSADGSSSPAHAEDGGASKARGLAGLDRAGTAPTPPATKPAALFRAAAAAATKRSQPKPVPRKRRGDSKGEAAFLRGPILLPKKSPGADHYPALRKPVESAFANVADLLCQAFDLFAERLAEFDNGLTSLFGPFNSLNPFGFSDDQTSQDDAVPERDLNFPQL